MARRDLLTLMLQFLQRARVFSLYRTILRGTRRICSLQTRVETRRFAREEIERHRSVTDLVRSLVPLVQLRRTDM